MSQNVPECPKSDVAIPAEPDPDAPLPPEQQTAIVLLLTGAGMSDVAAVVGVDRRTLYRWRHYDARFIRALRRQRAELLDTVNDRFRHMLDAALDTLQRHLADPYTPTSHRAAKTLLALARIGQPSTPARRPQSAIRNRQSA